jgi:hypothetical protein
MKLPSYTPQLSPAIVEFLFESTPRTQNFIFQADQTQSRTRSLAAPNGLFIGRLN